MAMLDPLNPKAEHAFAGSLLHVDAKQHDVGASNCMRRKWTGLVICSDFLRTVSRDISDLLGLINPFELGPSRGSLVELPEQPIVIGPEFL